MTSGLSRVSRSLRSEVVRAFSSPSSILINRFNKSYHNQSLQHKNTPYSKQLLSICKTTTVLELQLGKQKTKLDKQLLYRKGYRTSLSQNKYGMQGSDTASVPCMVEFAVVKLEYKPPDCYTLHFGGSPISSVQGRYH